MKAKDKTGDEPDYKRCAICDHCNLDGEQKRKFIFDRATDEYHCMLCAKEIQSAISDDEYDEYDWTELKVQYWKRGINKGGENFRSKHISRPSLPVFEWDEVDVEDTFEEVDEDESAMS